MNFDDFYSTIDTSFKTFGSKLKIEHSKGHEHLNYNCLVESGRGFGINNSGWDGNFVLFLHENHLHVARTHCKDLVSLLKIAYLWVDEYRSLQWIKENHISIELFEKIKKLNVAFEKDWNYVKNVYFSELNYYEEEKRKAYKRHCYLIDKILTHNELSSFIPALSHYSLFLEPDDYGNNPRYFIYLAKDNSIKVFNVDYGSEKFTKIDKSFETFDIAFDYYLNLIMEYKNKK